jgi:UDPglucose--hexose-1-phosphate uridylyltransferase
VVFHEPSSTAPHAAEGCPFCTGHESQTPHEIRAYGRPPGAEPDTPGWTVRVVPNLEPLLRIEEELQRRAEGMYDAATGSGAHEVIIESPDHVPSLANLAPEQMGRVLRAWVERLADLKRDPRIRSGFIFKNQGVAAGSRVPGHVHSQLIALPVTPKALKEMLDGAREHYQLKERCVYCDVLREELEARTRVVQTTEHFVALAPYASRTPFETWIVPREHRPDFEDAAEPELDDLAVLMVALLGRLERLLPEPAYNLFVYTAPNRQARRGRWATLDLDFHWHIQILPRSATPAGFEIGTGFYANVTLPEQSAAALRSSD